MITEIKPQAAALSISHSTVNYVTQGRKIFSISNGGWQWAISANYRNLTHDQWTVLQSNLLQSYGQWANFQFYVDYIYPNGQGFTINNPITFEVNANTPAGSHSIVLNNVNSYATTNSFKTGDLLYHPNLGPGNINVVAADAEVGATTTTVYLVRPIRAALTAGAEISMAEYVYASLGNKEYNVTRTTPGYYSVDLDFVVRDRFRNYQNG